MGSVRPFAARRSDSVVPPLMLVYSNRSSASSVPRVPRLMASIELAADLLEPRGELVQAHLVGLGGVPGEIEPPRPILLRPTLSSQRKPETKLPPG